MRIFSPVFEPYGRRGFALAMLLFAMTLVGCASVPPPDDSMNMAQSLLQGARDAGAADYAPVDLGFAQDKFQQAQTAMASSKYADASNLAAESRADAELARAKARLGATRAKIKSKTQDNSQLTAQGDQAEAAAQQQQAQEAEQDQHAKQDQPAPAASISNAPMQDMPAPPAQMLSNPTPGAGFQTMPDSSQPSNSSSAGGQP